MPTEPAGVPELLEDEGLDHQPLEPTVAKADAKPSETEVRLTALEKELATTKSNLEEAKRSEQYWADRARQAATPAVPDEDPDPDPEPGVSPFDGEKPDKFLDDLSVKGLQAALDRGVLTQRQFDQGVAALEQRLEQKFNAKLELQARHNSVDAELNKFPELKDKTSPLFVRAQQHFRQMVADDANMQHSPAALLASVRNAKKELELEAKQTTPDPQVTRRERIARQGGERTAAGSTEDEDLDNELSPQAREIVGHLSKQLTVKDAKGKVLITAEDNYRRNIGKNGR